MEKRKEKKGEQDYRQTKATSIVGRRDTEISLKKHGSPLKEHGRALHHVLHTGGGQYGGRRKRNLVFIYFDEKCHKIITQGKLSEKNYFLSTNLKPSP